MSTDDRTYQISRPVCPDVDALVPELREILESGQLTNGRHVRRLEEAVEAYTGAKVVALASNTSGMMLSWRAFDIVGEVLVPAFTFPATAHVLRWNGLDPVLVDCDRETFNIDLEDVERKLTSRTVGIAPVYIFGNAPDWEGLERIAREHTLRIVSDAAHAFGTTIGGRHAGHFGDVEIFSLAPTKILTTAEGGFAITRNAELADVLRRTRNYGNPGDYNCRELGLNARMTEVHALLGIHGLDGHEAQLEHRQRLAERYRSQLGGVPGIRFQAIAKDVRSTYNYFAIVVEPEEFGLTNHALKAFLSERGVESKVYFHPPIHRQSLYASLAGAEVPNTEWLCERILCIPLTGHLHEADVETISGFIVEASQVARSREDAVT